METESRLGAALARLQERLQEQVWYQQAKAKWEELDPRTRLITQAVAGALVVLLVLGGAVGSLASVRGLRKELARKQEVLRKLENANREMRELRSRATGAGGEVGGGDWTGYFTSTAGTAGIKAESLSVSTETAGAGLDAAKESLYDLSLRDVNARQVAKFAHYLENGARPVKLRNLTVETREDLSGFLTATLSVSAFSTREE